jgi:hypothetical protein
MKMSFVPVAVAMPVFVIVSMLMVVTMLVIMRVLVAMIMPMNMLVIVRVLMSVFMVVFVTVTLAVLVLRTMLIMLMLVAVTMLMFVFGFFAHDFAIPSLKFVFSSRICITDKGSASAQCSGRSQVLYSAKLSYKTSPLQGNCITISFLGEPWDSSTAGRESIGKT